MELFPAIDEEQFAFIKKIIDDSDYYLLIIGGRYGTTTNQGISYTEQEYEYAKSKGIKTVALIHSDPLSIPQGKTDQDPELSQKLEAFKNKVQDGKLVKFWSKADELPGLVSLSINKTIKTYPAIGWIRSNAATTQQTLLEINELRKENIELKKITNKSSSFTNRLELIHEIIIPICDRNPNINKNIPQTLDIIESYYKENNINYCRSGITDTINTTGISIRTTQEQTPQYMYIKSTPQIFHTIIEKIEPILRKIFINYPTGVEIVLELNKKLATEKQMHIITSTLYDMDVKIHKSNKLSLKNITFKIGNDGLGLFYTSSQNTDMITIYPKASLQWVETLMLVDMLYRKNIIYEKISE
tara:strand:- start:43446 stop:44519 length:1074 start_codon:yes stop_codon:yes gene_type:complete